MAKEQNSEIEQAPALNAERAPPCQVSGGAGFLLEYFSKKFSWIYVERAIAFFFLSLPFVPAIMWRS